MIDRLRAIAAARTAPGTWNSWHGDDDYAMNAYGVTTGPCDHDYTDDDGHPRHVVALTLLQHPRLASLGSPTETQERDADAMRWAENAAFIVTADRTYEALLAVAEAARRLDVTDDAAWPIVSRKSVDAVQRALAALDAVEEPR